MQTSIIEIRDLVKTFPKTSSLRAMFKRERKLVLDGITLDIPANQIFGLLGPNGAGKTTLIKLMCTLIRPTAGTIRIDGYDILRDGLQVRRRIGLVNCDDRSYYWRLSARENLRFYAALSNVPPERTERRIDELLALTGLTEAAETRLSEFSSGMKQRLAIARGLLSDPKILFMDEPSRSLDPIGAHELRCFIRDLVDTHPERTVILATNLMHEAEFLCDRIALINHGQLWAEGTIPELGSVLRPDHHHQLVVKHVSSEQLRDLLYLDGVVRVTEQASTDGTRQIDLFTRPESPGLPLTIRRITEMGGEIWGCDQVEITLEEVFRSALSGQPVARQHETAATVLEGEET